MIAAGIGILLGLVMLFLGMAFLEIERKERKRKKAEREAQIADSTKEEALARAIVDNEDEPAFVDIRRTKLGAFMVAQGVLLAVVGMALMIIHRYLVAIPWYITVPVIVVLLVICLVADAYMMGAPAPQTNEQDTQEVQDCTDNKQVEDPNEGSEA